MAYAIIPIAQEEPPSDYTLPDGTVWRRSGSCSRCGECCKSGDPFADDQTNPPNPCRLLVDEGAGVYSCGDRESHTYLIGCNVWPSIPEHILDYPSCSYAFELIEAG